MKKTIPLASDASTEEKIKEAARIVFTQKGYAGTRTRDIAEKAGINLALLNYYFRSKEKLFEMIMMEKMQKLFGILAPILNNDQTTLDNKIQRFVNQYLDLLILQPDLPIFVLSELRNHPERFATQMNIKKTVLESHFFKQLQESRPDMNALHFILNLMGMILFPFIGRPILESTGNINGKTYMDLIEERKKLIPRWVNAMLKVKL